MQRGGGYGRGGIDTDAITKGFLMIGFVVGMVLIGLLAGFLARAIVPGRDPMSIMATIALGVIGSFVGGLLADVLFRNDTQDQGIHTSGFVGSVIGAVIALLVYRATMRRSAHR